MKHLRVFLIQAAMVLLMANGMFSAGITITPVVLPDKGVPREFIGDDESLCVINTDNTEDEKSKEVKPRF